MRHNYLCGYNFNMRPLSELKFLVQRLLYLDFLCIYMNLFITVCFIKNRYSKCIVCDGNIGWSTLYESFTLYTV